MSRIHWFLSLFLGLFLFCSQAYSHDAYVHFLTQDTLNPFQAPIEDIQKENDEITKKLDLAFLEIEESENKLLSEKKQIESLGYDAVHFLMSIKELISQLSSQEKDIVLRGQPTQEDFLKYPKLNELYKILLPAKNLSSTFFHHLDDYIQNTLDLAMALGYHGLRSYIAELPEKIKNRRDIKKSYQKIEYLKKKYLENKDQYGQAKDTLRTTTYSKFFNELLSFYKTVRETQEQSSFSRLSWLFLTLQHMWNILYRIPKYSSLAVKGLKLIKAALFPGKLNADRLAFNVALNDVMNKTSDVFDLPVRVEGEEFLPKKTPRDTINIFAPSHRNAIFDLIGLAKLDINNMVFFGAANNFIPNFLNKFFNLKDSMVGALNKNPGFILVGKGADPKPIDKAIQIVTQTQVRNFLIFPGGRLTEGLGASAGVRAKFASDDGLIGQFQAAGFKVNIIPISMRHNATMFNGIKLQGSLSNQEFLSVRVAPNIDDETRRIITNIIGPEGVGDLMRYGLIDDLVTNNQLIWGQVRASVIPRELPRYLGTISCRHLFGK